MLMRRTVAFVIVYPKVRRQRLQPATATGDVEAQKRRLLVEIARLDDSYEAGEVAEERYQSLRRAKKGQLAVLMQRSRPRD